MVTTATPLTSFRARAWTPLGSGREPAGSRPLASRRPAPSSAPGDRAAVLVARGTRDVDVGLGDLGPPAAPRRQSSQSSRGATCPQKATGAALVPSCPLWSHRA